MKTIFNLISDMQGYGLFISCDKLNTSGKLSRCATTRKKHSKNGWYIIHINGDFINAVYGDHQLGETIKWSNKEPGNSRRLQPKQNTWIDYQKQIKQEQDDRLSRLRSNYTRLVKPLTQNHAYIDNKGLSELLGLHVADPLGVTKNNELIIPMRNLNGELMGYQTIDVSGNKRFAPGSQKKGNFYTLSSKEVDLENSELLFITEGFANSLSTYLALNDLLDGVSYGCITAFDVGNIEPVLLNLWSKYPNKAIVLVADNDAGNETNIGVETCVAIVKKYSYTKAINIFIPKDGSDE